MKGRSLKLSLDGKSQVEHALTHRKWSTEDLAASIGVQRATATNFRAGKAVDRKNFVKFCEALELNWEIISGQKIPNLENLEKSTDDSTCTSQPSQYIASVRHNLPQPDYGQFVGREQELKKIFQKLRPYPHSTNSVITIDGIGGIGKSALALEVAHRFLRDYEKLLVEERFEVIIWSSAKQSVLKPDRGIVSLRRSFQTLEDICKAIAFTLEIEEQVYKKQNEIVDFICRALTQKRTLLVVDNLESVDDEAVMEFLQELLPAPTKAVVTTRHRLDVAYPVRLLGMPRKDAEQLIDQECQKKGVSLNSEQKDKLYKRTGGVPLAIVWTVARIGFGYTVDTVLATLGKPQGDLAHFCFKEVVDHIRDRDSYKLLLALVICKGEASREELSCVAGLEEDEFSCDEGLVELDVLSLVSRREGKFTMLPLTKEYVNHELKSDPGFEKEALKRLDAYIEKIILAIKGYCRQKILNLYSRMRLLSGDEIGVDQLYVDVWLLNRSPRTFQVSQDKLLETFDLRNDRLGLGDRIKRNPGFEVASNSNKLLILGKPGSGKTTFLKRLAVDWCKGEFHPNLIAVLIELRRIRDESRNLLNTICLELGLSEEPKVLELMQRGKLLLLMDGLDDLPTSELRRDIQDQLQQLTHEYPNNRFILTCRTQIIETIPSGFTSVEVADFSQEQVRQFVQNWFIASGESHTEVLRKWEIFVHAINYNSALKELTVAPILLSLMCLIFHDEGEMPSQVIELYKRGIRLLLEKWNDAKEITGWEVGSDIYQALSVEQKEALLIEIAARKFENPENFALFTQHELVAQITEFLKLSTPQEGVAVLKGIEAQHGLLIERADRLWSFSHLTFQEYFAAQWLAQLTSEQLVEKINDQRWQNVINQIVKSQQPADSLLRLIKRAIDQFIANEPTLKEFLRNTVHRETTKHGNMEYEQQLTDLQNQRLQSYYNASSFLLELMNIKGAVSPSVRSEIKDSLVLPSTEL